MSKIVNLDEYRVAKDFVTQVLDRCHRWQVTEATAIKTIKAVLKENLRNSVITPKYRVTCKGDYITLQARGRRKYRYVL